MRRSRLIGLLAGGVSLWLTACGAPHYFVPQKDIAAAQVGSTANGRIVLVASRTSKFKNDLVNRISKALVKENVAVEIVGIEDLAAIAPEKYSALVAISTCMGWGLDPLVRDFLHRLPDKQHIVLVVTSNGGWLPKGKDADVDAISSASVLAGSEAVSFQVLSHLKEKMPPQ